jgi:hypothetical protein
MKASGSYQAPDKYDPSGNIKEPSKIKVLFADLTQEDYILEVYEKRADWEFYWTKGKLTCNWNREESMYFICSAPKKNQLSNG